MFETYEIHYLFTLAKIPKGKELLRLKRILLMYLSCNFLNITTEVYFIALVLGCMFSIHKTKRCKDEMLWKSDDKKVIVLLQNMSEIKILGFV